jgi:tetratricopeptide (TPR) repeat protein
MMVALGAVTVAVCAFAASAILPAWSQSKARSALDLAAARTDRASLARAADQADLAARLNPLATEPLADAATIAADRGLPAQARRYLLEAVNRAPYDASVWDRLALLALSLGDRSGARRAALRALSLDPANPAATAIAAETVTLAVPPQDSPTATGTPLPEPLPSAPVLPSTTPTPGATTSTLGATQPLAAAHSPAAPPSQTPRLSPALSNLLQQAAKLRQRGLQHRAR